MLGIRLEIERVNYEKCVEALLPSLVEHCAVKENPNELDKFLAMLGADAAPAACAVLEEMDADGRDRMVVWLVGAHEERMRNSANRHLAELTGGPIIRIGRLVAQDRPGSRLSLQALQVGIDYRALLASPIVGDGIESIGSEHGVLKGAAKLAVQMGAHMSPASLEKYSVALLNSEKIKSRLMSVLADALRQAGLDVTLADFIVESTDAIELPEALPSPVEGAIPDAFEDALLGALAARVRKMRKE